MHISEIREFVRLGVVDPLVSGPRRDSLGESWDWSPGVMHLIHYPPPPSDEDRGLGVDPGDEIVSLLSKAKELLTLRLQERANATQMPQILIGTVIDPDWARIRRVEAMDALWWETFHTTVPALIGKWLTLDVYEVRDTAAQLATLAHGRTPAAYSSTPRPEGEVSGGSFEPIQHVPLTPEQLASLEAAFPQATLAAQPAPSVPAVTMLPAPEGPTTQAAESGDL